MDRKKGRRMNEETLRKHKDLKIIKKSFSSFLEPVNKQ